MNYVIRYKNSEQYRYVGVKLPKMDYIFTKSILDAFFHSEKKYATDGVKFLKEKYPDLKFQILAV